MKRVLVAAAILLWAIAVAAGSKVAQPARLNKLNVVAFDAQGQPVTGLHSADFQLLEEGKRQGIAFFRFTGGHAIERHGYRPRAYRRPEESRIERGFVLIFSDPSRRPVSRSSAAEIRHGHDAGR